LLLGLNFSNFVFSLAELPSPFFFFFLVLCRRVNQICLDFFVLSAPKNLGSFFFCKLLTDSLRLSFPPSLSQLFCVTTREDNEIFFRTDSILLFSLAFLFPLLLPVLAAFSWGYHFSSWGFTSVETDQVPINFPLFFVLFPLARLVPRVVLGSSTISLDVTQLPGFGAKQTFSHSFFGSLKFLLFTPCAEDIFYIISSTPRIPRRGSFKQCLSCFSEGSK